MSQPAQFFRAGAGALLMNDGGLVLAFERADVPGAWQLPQGGLAAGEEPMDGALRELEEETGIRANSLRLVQAYPEPLVYELPPGMRSVKTGRGQVLYWFLFRFHGRADVIDVAPGREFRAWQWVPLDLLIELAADFRKPVYRRLADYFHAHLARM
jgi:putative (di)nucleoside polyphosphate hydrolase